MFEIMAEELSALCPLCYDGEVVALGYDEFMCLKCKKKIVIKRIDIKI